MSTSRTDRVREILDLALEHPSAERAAFVAGASAGDEFLLAEVMSLLSALEDAGDSLEPPRHAEFQAPLAEPLTGLAFGPYIVGERIGEGGMGVVYATRDTRLERTVAVKALPPSLARDPHRRARLEQEARMLASLNHPNIAAIHGIENTPRGPVMVLEFVPGRTLAEELAAHRLSIEDSTAIARQIARGLEAAHNAGIVHRDLKPANIKLTPEGVAKILDLGVAKAQVGATREMGSDSVVRAAATLPGVIVGTAAYMSPEQARGRPVDRRADIWAFGCVLFEMLTGKRAFDGETASDAVAAVLRAEPNWALLPEATPYHVRRLLARCLHKDPDRRLRDAGDALLELDEPAVPTAGISRSQRALRVSLAAAVLAVLAFAGLAVFFARDNSALHRHGKTIRYSIPAPSLGYGTIGSPIAISRDGSIIAYVAGGPNEQSLIHTRRLDSFNTSVVGETHSAWMPFFSPDGKSIAFLSSRADGSLVLKRVSVDGGTPQVISTLNYSMFGGSWGDDGNIVYSAGSASLWKVPSTGGKPVAIGTMPVSYQEQFSQPEVLPGSRFVLFSCWRFDMKSWNPSIEALSLDTNERFSVMTDASQPRYMASLGMLAFFRGDAVLAVPFDPATCRVDRTRPASTLASIGGGASIAMYSRFAVSNDGVLVYIPAHDSMDETDLAWFGIDKSSSTVYRGSSSIWTLRLSPDESKIAFTTHPPKADLWMHDLVRGTTIRLTNSDNVFYPVWSPDGRRIAFQRQLSNTSTRIEWIPSDGSGSPEILYTDPSGLGGFPTDFSPDGSLLAVSLLTGKESDTDLFILPLEGERQPVRLFNTQEDRVGIRFSPDRSLIAYTSLETGRAEIYVQPYPSMDRKLPVSIRGGERPDWSADGSTLFYRYGSTIYAADISRSPELAASKPRVVLEKLPGMRYDATGDGSRFIMGRPRGDWGQMNSINIVSGGLE